MDPSGGGFHDPDHLADGSIRRSRFSLLQLGSNISFLELGSRLEQSVGFLHTSLERAKGALDQRQARTGGQDDLIWAPGGYIINSHALLPTSFPVAHDGLLSVRLGSGPRG